MSADIQEVSIAPEEKEKSKSGKNPLTRIRKQFDKDPALQNLLCWNETYQAIQFRKPFKYIKTGEEMTDAYQHELLYYISEKMGMDAPMHKLEVAMTVESRKYIVNPIKNYLEKLTWDRVPRLGTWLHKYTGAPCNPYTAEIGKIVLIAAVARIYRPGIKYDYMMILEGKTRIGKSRLLQALGGEWYLDMHLEDTNKDIIDNMRGKWIIEISEMAGFGRREIEWLKAFLSRGVDRVRLSYGRRSQDYPRQSILIGSMNPSGDNTYLRDDTGNARYWPIACSDKVDVDGIIRDKDNLFSEAMYHYNQNYPLYLRGDVFEMAEKEQSLRLNLDPWYYDIAKLSMQFNQATSTEILDRLHMPTHQRGIGEQMRIGKIMKQLGWFKRKNSFGYYYSKEPSDGGAQDTANS